MNSKLVSSFLSPWLLFLLSLTNSYWSFAPNSSLLLQLILYFATRIYIYIYIYILTWVNGSYQLQKKIKTSKHIIVCSCLTFNLVSFHMLRNCLLVLKPAVFSILWPFACVLSCAHHTCPLLVNLAHFSFSFISKFEYYVLCDTFSDSLLSDEVVFSPAPCVHLHQSTHRRKLWNWQPCSLVEENPHFNAGTRIGLECDECFHLCSPLYIIHFLKRPYLNL